MDPVTAIEAFNDYQTTTEERGDIARDLTEWADMGSFAPCGTLDDAFIDELWKADPQAAKLAESWNHYATPMGEF